MSLLQDSHIRTSVIRMASSSRWMAWFLMLAAVSIAVHLSLHPYLVKATLAHLPSSATTEDKAVLAQRLSDELPSRLMFLPVRLLTGWAAFALTLYAIGVAFRPPERLRYVKVFALQVRAETFNVLGQFTAVCSLFLAPTDETGPVAIPFSAAMFSSSSDVVMFSLLNSLNLFTLFYVTFLTVGMKIQSRFSGVKAISVVVLTWSLSLLFHVGTTSFLRKTLHLLV